MHFTPWPFWFRIVSIATVVLPVLRSPMISSRWPRPIGVIASMALMPVCIGSCTGLRPMIDGAWISRRRSIGSTSGPRPSIGSPSALTTRPRRPSPTGTERMRPVALTVWPSSTPSASPSTTAPIDSSSRLSARPSDAVLELEQLVHTRLRQPGDTGDAVADLGHAADRLGLDRGVEAFEVLAQRGDDVVGVDRELCHGGPFSSLQQRLQLAEAVAHGAVDDRVAH